MAKHLFVSNLKTILRSKPALFWSFMFPLMLATLFYFAFGNLGSNDTFQTFEIALVEGGETAPGTAFYSALSAVSDLDGEAGEGDLFRVRTVPRGDADSLLEKGEIRAYYVDDGTIRLVVNGSGFRETIAKVFLDKYLQTAGTIQNILRENPAAAQDLFDDLSDARRPYTDIPLSSSSDGTVIYFYALLAMTCLMGSTVSVDEIIKLQANMSPLAARINASPVAKFKVFLCNIAAAILFQLTVILSVLAYMILILHVDFGGQTAYIILTCMLGGILGIFFGTAVSASFKTAGIKYAITIGGTMLSSFLSGLMIHDIKYLVHQHVPVLGYLSPANLIADALYSLYYYEGYTRFYINLLGLVIFSAVLCIFTCFVLRRKTHASL